MHLLKIVTHPLSRGEGYASKLLSGAESVLDSSGKIFLEVATNNKAALNLYEALGYTTLRKVKRFDSDGSDALEMMKQIE